MTRIIDPDSIVWLRVEQSELFISVIIPAFNNPDGLRACLAALTRQSIPARQFETIVVDDGSSPPLANVVDEFSGQLEIACIRVRNAGPAIARNHGARAAKGRYLAFTDHDCLPTAEWLLAFRDGFSTNHECMLGGPKHNGLSGNIFSCAHQIASNYAEEWFRDSTGVPGYFTTNNMAVPREVFLSMGGFNESFPFAHEDREFGARWADHGRLSVWMPAAIVVHRHKLTLRTFLRQQFRYGAGAVNYRAARGQAQLRSTVRFHGLRFHFGLVTAPFRQHGERRLQLAALLISAQAAYAAGVVAGGVTLHRRPPI